MKSWKAGAMLSASLLISACSGGSSGDAEDPPTPPAGNTPPTANAGSDQVVNAGSAVSLSGASSADTNGSIATYAWTQTTGASVALTAASTATPTFTAPASGVLGFQLTVTDNGGASHSDTVTVTINAPPVANAGADQTVQAGAAVSLNGTATADSDGTVASYAWSQTAGAAVVLTAPTTAQPTFTAPGSAATLSFELTVTDNHGATHADAVTITVTATPPSAPIIARQPTSPAALEYGSALLFVVASGTDLTYEWRSDTFGTVLKSGPEPWLMRTGLGMNDDGNCYRVVISNALGAVTSEPGCVSVAELQTDLDPFQDEDEGMGQDDLEYALAYGNTLLNVAQLASGGLTGPSLSFFGLSGVMTALPLNLGAPNPCYSGSHHGSTLDGAALTSGVPVPIGRHSISEAWDECRATSDALNVSDGAILIDYDFPERFGEGSFTLYLSGYRSGPAIFNGIVRATVTTFGGTDDRRDEIELVVEEDFSSPGLRITSGIDQTISIQREYSEDETLMDDTTIDFDVTMSTYDREGPAGSIFRSGGRSPRLRWVADAGGGNPSHVSDETFSVGLTGGFHLATLQADYGVMGWEFTVLPPDQCPEGYVCVDPPAP